ncbi:MULTISPECIES: hypothetical protein [unclassified Flavobacterium]|uniref:hypothetical protein n=1 Tax=unclassified Flavobacterium TaxID=196869 RepID=UPI0012920E52|nr:MULTISPECIES: hypothetical protein [unclassified Flavobacterium]MQP52277.1 hypothetical protein [Flavobacterium sp. LMO9]MQP62347.1 hypothetical protein [Flavobacterium sp. LMO6]
MDNLEWKCEHEIITLDSDKRQIVRCNITDNPHNSFESYEKFEDFLINKNFTAMIIKSNFSVEIYNEILNEVKKRCSEDI